MSAKPNVDKSGEKTRRRTGAPPFAKGHDPRRGKGPKKGAPNAGRPPDFLKALKAEGAIEATEQVRALLAKCGLNPDQLIKVAKEFDPADKTITADLTLNIRFADE